MGHIALLSYTYAAVMAIGGVIGFVRAKSNVSLLAGLGAAIIACIAGTIAPAHRHIALTVTGALALVMLVVFAVRYRKTQKPMPAIPMMAISILVLLVCGYELIEAFVIHAAGP